MSKGPAQFAWKSRPLHGALGHFLKKEEEEDGEFDYSRTGHLWYTIVWEISSLIITIII